MSSVLRGGIEKKKISFSLLAPLLLDLVAQLYSQGYGLHLVNLITSKTKTKYYS